MGALLVLERRGVPLVGPILPVLAINLLISLADPWHLDRRPRRRPHRRRAHGARARALRPRPHRLRQARALRSRRCSLLILAVDVGLIWYAVGVAAARAPRGEDGADGRARVLLARRVARDRDPHRRASLPDGASEPGRPVLLHARITSRVARVVVAEAHEHLVQADLVQHLDARPRRRAPPPSTRRARSSARQLGGAAAPERAQRRVGREAARATRPLRARARRGRGRRRRRAAGTGATVPSDVRWAARSRRSRSRCRTGTFSHLCPSTAQESASSRPATRCASRGLAAAHSPNAPSTCSQAPCARGSAAAIAASGSQAPGVDVAGLGADDRRAPSTPASTRASSSGRMRPCSSTGTRIGVSAPSPSMRSAVKIELCASSPTTTVTAGAPCSPRASTSQPARSSTRGGRRRGRSCWPSGRR